MKIALLLLCLLAVTVYTQDTSLVLKSHFDSYEDGVTNLNDKIKAAKCITQSYEQVKQIVELAKNVASGNIIGSVTDVYNITKRLFNMLDNCSVLFCYGPTYQKCQNENPQGCEKWGLIIYPKCKEGFTNWDCCVCANQCPHDFRDDGLYCAKPSSYGRGAGYALWDKDKCFKDNAQGCEKNGLLWYPKCRQGFHNVGCCVCSPNCPSGWTDIGVSCKKPESYGRGVGYPITFGVKCLDQKVSLKMADNCPLQQQIMLELAQTVSDKLELTYQNGDNYQTYYPDNVKELGELIDQYTDQCYQAQITY